jgi:hypothetical protein
MSTSKINVICVALVSMSAPMFAQGTLFQDLDFESATLSPSQGSVYVSAASALPGWSAYLGTTLQTQVYQNGYTTGAPSIDIFGPNYASTGSESQFDPGIIDGNYTVFLQSGFVEGTLGANASIEQNGTIPPGTVSLQFRAWVFASPTSILSVSFNGNSLSPVVIGSGPNYILYSANISSYAGQTGELEFTSVFNSQGPSWNELDDITFSTTAVVPEPSPLALTGIGGLLLALCRRFTPKRP